MLDWAAIDALAQKEMLRRKAHLRREIGFIYRHGQRVAVGALRLRAKVTQDASHDDALRLAGMFHDIGKGIEPHARTGALLAADLLAPLAPKDLLDEVVFLIGAHNNHSEKDTSACLLRDADILDHFGSVEVGLSFQYGMGGDEGGMPLTLGWYQDEFDAYAERTRGRINFDVSRAIYDEKVAFSRAFAQRLAVEMGGGYL